MEFSGFLKPNHATSLVSVVRFDSTNSFSSCVEISARKALDFPHSLCAASKDNDDLET